MTVRPLWVVTAWVFTSVMGFWRFEGRYLLPVAAPTLGSRVEAGLETNTYPATLYVAWNPECPCTRFEDGHLRELSQTRGLRVVALAVGDTPTARRDWQDTGIVGEFRPDRRGLVAGRMGISATPGVVLVDGHGRVRYRGSLHAGRFCNDRTLAFAQRAVDETLRGKAVSVPSTPFYGCALPR